MNKIILALAATAAILIGVNYYLNDQSPVSNLQNIADKINSDPNSTWTATVYPRFTYNTDQLKTMFNLKRTKPAPGTFDKAPFARIRAHELPTNFDSRTAWPKCDSIKEVRDQSACGSCWAFGAATAMSDRLCIASGQKDQRRISTEELVECCYECGDGCNGGELYPSWSYWKESGIVTGDLYADTNSCKPYPFPPCNHHSTGPYDDCSKHDYSTPSCKRECSNKDYKKSFKNDKIFGASVYTLDDEETIMRDLVTNGPVEAAFDVYEDFPIYKSGVYRHTHGSMLGGHAIRIIGYGVEDNVKYWLCVNSWNDNWGDKGTFKILRGQNHCGIEGDVVGGLAKL